jgi:hypothetical protein
MPHSACFFACLLVGRPLLLLVAAGLDMLCRAVCCQQMIGLGYGSYPPVTFPEAVLWIVEMICMAG